MQLEQNKKKKKERKNKEEEENAGWEEKTRGLWLAKLM